MRTCMVPVSSRFDFLESQRYLSSLSNRFLTSILIDFLLVVGCGRTRKSHFDQFDKFCYFSFNIRFIFLYLVSSDIIFRQHSRKLSAWKPRNSGIVFPNSFDESIFGNVSFWCGWVQRALSVTEIDITQD